VNEDGSVSVATNEVYLFWDMDATGMLIEGNDTIGFFRIMNPREFIAEILSLISCHTSRQRMQ
jgi:hypothetical protein